MMPPVASPQPMTMGGGSGFLRSAATTAAGIAGGALLFEGIQSLFGQHAGGILGNSGVQPGLSETVINNYYGDDPGRRTETQSASNQSDAGTGRDYASNDPGFDNSSDDSSDQDFSSDDSSGGDDYA
jgi:hypothetical protein